MTSIPKPPRRLPKPRRRIARSAPPKARRDSQRAKDLRRDTAAWAKAVKERAGQRCELENLDGLLLPEMPHGGGVLDAHHAIFSKKAHPRLRHDLDVGVALCRYAHTWVHGSDRARFMFRVWFAGVHPYRYRRLCAKASRESRLS